MSGGVRGRKSLNQRNFLLLDFRDEMMVWVIFARANYAFFQLLSAYAFGMLELMRSHTAVH